MKGNEIATFEEIKKATECSSPYRCLECDLEICRAKHLPEYIVDIISRQKAEIENLNIELKIKSQKRANIFEITDAFERGRSRGIKEFAEKLKEYFPSIAKAIDHTVEEMKGE